ncbi:MULTISPECIES: TniQ family protein [Methylomonas]|uniref:TniQ family protein n=1 Tax=Methylomonas TaxID=416 RepID=UPI0007C98E3C|nr:TniQ family protein [Methylomonas koyamae]
MTGTPLTLVCPAIRTSSYPDENPIGYLMRLADKNTYPSFRWLLAGKGVETVDYAKLYQTFLKADWTGFQNVDHGLAQICTLPNIHLNATRLRYCPLCLQEAHYWRIGWQLKLASACTHHRVWLHDVCPQCYREQSFIKAPDKHCNCLAQLSSAQAIIAPSSVVQMQQFLENGALEAGNHWFEAKQLPTLRQRSELLAFLMKWLAIGDDLAKPGRPQFQHVSGFQATATQCADALFSDDGGFWRYLQAIHFNRASHIGIQQKRLVYFYRQFFKEFPESLFEPLKTVVEEYVTLNLIRDITKKHTLFSNDAKKVQPWVSFNRACKQYNLAASVLSRAITDKHVAAHHQTTQSNYTQCSIYRPDLEKILPHLKSLITAHDAAEILGVTKAQFLQLQKSGCFKFEIPPREGYCSTWQYSKLELETLIDTINRGAAPPTDDCVLLAATLQNRIRGSIEMPFLHVFKAIVSGQLIVRKPDDRPRQFRNLSLDKAEICRWLNQLRPQVAALTVTNAAKVLGISEEFAYQLVNRGYLNHQLDSRNAKRICPDHISQFRQDYVMLSKLSEASGLSSARLVDMLASSEIFPVDHNVADKLRQKLYRRADVLKTSALSQYVEQLPAHPVLENKVGDIGLASVGKPNAFNSASEFHRLDNAPFEKALFNTPPKFRKGEGC